MSRTQVPKPHHPHHDVPEDREPPELPVEPDQGLIPPHIPDDPEHERIIDPAAVAPDPVIALAKRDIDAGMVDTDMRATPGLDAKLRARLVPGPGGKPASGR
jgi:hypothetical protein